MMNGGCDDLDNLIVLQDESGEVFVALEPRLQLASEQSYNIEMSSYAAMLPVRRARRPQSEWLVIFA